MKNDQTTPHGPDHVNYRDRIVPLHRHHAGRLTGESTGWTMDARGDESLYRPSRLGRAGCSLRRVAAGADCPFDLSFRAGTAELPAGASVVFWMPGQGSLGTMPQTEDAQKPGFVELATETDCALRLICAPGTHYDLSGAPSSSPLPRQDVFDVGNIALGFAVEQGCLRAGDEVFLRIGRSGGFIWKCLAGRKEFKVMIKMGPDVVSRRLPEPVRIDIEPLAVSALEVHLPGSARRGENLRAVVSARDVHDNRASYDGPLIVECGGRVYRSWLQRGRAELELTASVDAPLQAVARLPEADKPLAARSNWCVPAGEFKLFFGDLHTHDHNSTAEGYPHDCYRWARDEKRLDFQSLPVQVHRWIDNEKWFLVKHCNEYFLEEGRFVTLLAFEWQHSGCGDKVVHYLGGDQPYLPVDDPRYDSPAKLYRALRESDALVISHHPGYALDLHVPGTCWEVLDTAIDRLVELWSMHGSSEGFDADDRPLLPPRRPEGAYAALRSGVRMGFCAGSDTHAARPGGSRQDCRPYYGGLCAVWAADLTRRALFDALMARRTYALTGARIALCFKVNDFWMGAEAPFNERCAIQVVVQSPGRIREVQILRNAGLVHRILPAADQAELCWNDRIREPAFYHCRVVQEDGHLAVSSPVWIG